jgi:hypothetical protein
MKRRILNIAVILVFLCQSTIISAQGWKNAKPGEAQSHFASIRAWFQNHEQYHFKIIYESFAYHLDNTAAENDHGLFLRQKDNYYSEFMGTENVQNANYNWTIDSSNSIVVVRKVQKDFKKIGDLEAVEAGLKLAKSVTIKHIADKKTIRLDFGQEASIIAYEVSCAADGQLLDITIYYNSSDIDDNEGDDKTIYKPKLYITFQLQKNSKVPNAYFMDSKYFSITSKGVVLQDKYSDYQVIDNRNTNKTN